MITSFGQKLNNLTKWVPWPVLLIFILTFIFEWSSNRFLPLTQTFEDSGRSGNKFNSVCYQIYTAFRFKTPNNFKQGNWLRRRRPSWGIITYRRIQTSNGGENRWRFDGKPPMKRNSTCLSQTRDNYSICCLCHIVIVHLLHK